MSDYSNTFRDGERVKLPEDATTKKTFCMSYAFDVPFYADFTVEAETEDEAIAIAQAALDKGRFRDINCEPCYENEDGHRVFSSGEADEFDNSPTLDELAPDDRCSKCGEHGNEYGDTGLCLDCFKVAERKAARP